MHQSIINLNDINKKIKNTKEKNLNLTKKPTLIAVSKTFNIEDINPLVDFGHIHFGENRVQEALDKWTKIKENNDTIKLHLIGKLQTNKVKFAVKIFDYIHTVDSIKLARKISSEENKLKKKIKLFIQVNIGLEEQKSGVSENNLKELIEECSRLNLSVIGLMCIPPNDNNSKNYFKKMKELGSQYSLSELSMGMSSDYLEAIEEGSTYVRIGSKIFGERAKRF
jgi:pyridoxal phosphate enzyme (YggS family)